jgi:hypothetical protein
LCFDTKADAGQKRFKAKEEIKEKDKKKKSKKKKQKADGWKNLQLYYFYSIHQNSLTF